jgi:hypothetical protein
VVLCASVRLVGDSEKGSARIPGAVLIRSLDGKRPLLTCARNSRFGSHIGIPSQLTTEEGHNPVTASGRICLEGIQSPKMSAYTG